LRERFGYPDPIAVQLTDYQFFKRYYERGCSLCENAPLTRKVYWRFHCFRLCSSCYHHNLIRDYLIDSNIDRKQYQYLPYIPVSGFNPRASYRNRDFHYKLYWENDILDHYPTEDEIEEMKARRNNIHEFERKLDHAIDIINNQRIQEEILFSQKKATQVLDFLQTNFPGFTLDELRRLPSYKSALNSKVPFTNKGMATRLKNRAKKIWMKLL
jgi:hypothetical protein